MGYLTQYVEFRRVLKEKNVQVIISEILPVLASEGRKKAEDSENESLARLHTYICISEMREAVLKLTKASEGQSQFRLKLLPWCWTRARAHWTRTQENTR
ncbi:unnamed protein product [Lepidochelys kempii]